MNQTQIRNRKPGKAQRLRRGGVAVATAGMVLTLPGCFINRISEVQEQFCHFDEHFTVQMVEPGSGLSPTIEFHEPVLLDSDILLMAGAQPSFRLQNDLGYSMHWVAEKDVTPAEPEFDFEVVMEFVAVEDEHRLAGIRFDPKFSAVLNPEFISYQSMTERSAEVCNTGWTLATRKMDLDLTEEDLATLPNRREVEYWLGRPSEMSLDGGQYDYRFRLKGEEQRPLKLEFSLWFDSEKGTPLGMKSNFSRFTSEADFVEGKLIVGVSI